MVLCLDFSNWHLLFMLVPPPASDLPCVPLQNEMLEEGQEYAVMLYTWRSCSRAIPQVPRSPVSSLPTPCQAPPRPAPAMPGALSSRVSPHSRAGSPALAAQRLLLAGSKPLMSSLFLYSR